MLQRDGFRVAVGESCTGGLVTARLVDSSGELELCRNRCGRVLERGQAESCSASIRCCSKTEGAVSEAVAVAMAEGARRVGATDIGIGVTGVAGPGGGSDEKPVGTVCVGVVGPGSERET